MLRFRIIDLKWQLLALFVKNRIIQAKLQNSRKEQGNTRFLIKFYDNLSLVSRWFTPQKTLKITEIAHEHSIDQTGVLCVLLHIGDLVLVLNRSDCLLAKNRQSFVLIGHSWLLIYSLYCGDVFEWFIASHLNQVCIAYRNISTLFKLFLFW